MLWAENSVKILFALEFYDADLKRETCSSTTEVIDGEATEIYTTQLQLVCFSLPTPWRQKCSHVFTAGYVSMCLQLYMQNIESICFLLSKIHTIIVK